MAKEKKPSQFDEVAEGVRKALDELKRLLQPQPEPVRIPIPVHSPQPQRRRRR